MSLTILIADHAMSDRLPLVRSLEAQGHDVRYALSAAEVSAFVAAEALDVALVSEHIAAGCSGDLSRCAGDAARGIAGRAVRVMVFGPTVAATLAYELQ